MGKGGNRKVVRRDECPIAKHLEGPFCIQPKPHQRADPIWPILEKIERKRTLTLGSYRVLKQIGSGAVAKVYLVELPGCPFYFALKILPKLEMRKRNKVKRVITEHSILCNSDHPFVVTLYRTYNNDGVVGFLMEYCKQGDMYQHLYKQPLARLEEFHAKIYAAQVVTALQYMHVNGIIYRDLKPENVLLTEQGHVKLTDFDLAHVADPPNVTVHMNEDEATIRPFIVGIPRMRRTSFVGTDEYIAPEIILGRGYSSSIDWWSLGIFIFEMIYGSTPFGSKNRNLCFKKIVEKNLHFPYYPSVSQDCKDLIERLLCKDPMNRLGSQLGASEIKAHPFFKSIKWPLLRKASFDLD